MNVMGVNCIYDPGCHCAFTDIIRWRGRVYVCFREAVNHSVNPSGQIVVLASADYGESFQAHGRMAHAGTDLRDPHFFTVDDFLCVTIPSWELPRPESGTDKPTRVMHVGRSPDGIHWELSEIESLRGKTLWRPRKGSDDAWYAVAYGAVREPGDRMAELVRSTDGLNWETVSEIHREGSPNETELCFLPDGELLALVRREADPKKPLIARSRPPYRSWKKVGCSRFLQGPLLERLPDGSLLVVGRSTEPLESEERTGECRTRAFRLDPETGVLDYIFTLPSGGDTSYAGFCDLGGGRGLLSYYSGHRYSNGSWRGGGEPQRCGIHLARLAF